VWTFTTSAGLGPTLRHQNGPTRGGGVAMWVWFVVTFYAGMLAGLFIAGLMHAAARGDGR